MDLISFLILLVIAALCGGAAQALAGYSLGGCLVSIVVGFIGALIGMWLAGALGLPEPLAINVGGRSFPIVWSVVGGAVFALLVGFIRRATVSATAGPRRRYW
jgi:uncharacterized membrane protein YeaQ/YmgE (transglycosylase-associated protein family)